MTLSLALLALLLWFISLSLGFILAIILYFGLYSSGMTGRFWSSLGGVLTCLKICLHILSSREWKVMTHIRPFGLMIFKASFKAFSKTFNSSLTSILMAWNTFLAGWDFLRYFSGTFCLIISASCKVVSIGAFSLSFASGKCQNAGTANEAAA